MLEHNVIFAVLKKLYSITIILLLTFAGLMELWHEFNESEEHCSEDLIHVCPEDGHHHCSLCDTTLQSGIKSVDPVVDLSVGFPLENLCYSQVGAVYSISQLYSGRAPPAERLFFI